MTGPAVCATPGCDNPVATPAHTGRPPIYCSPACRPIRHPRRPPPPANPTETDQPDEINIETDQDPDPDGHPGRTWTVTLRRGQHHVIVGHHLGRFTAAALTDNLRELLEHPGGPID